MEQINKNIVIKNRTADGPHKRCFEEISGFQSERQDGAVAFVVKFKETIGPLLFAQTGIKLIYGEKHNNFFYVIRKDDELRKIKQWEKEQGTRVFLKDCLSLSLALQMNFIGEVYSEIGRLEHDAKEGKDDNALKELAKIAYMNIIKLPFYKDADCICAVPSNKEFNLPHRIVEMLSRNLNVPDVTKNLKLMNQKTRAVKEASMEEKWDVWDEANLKYDGNLKGKKIILIDDKYQSGVTMQYIAMKLQEAGAQDVFGMCMVKTLRDTDNVK